MGDGKRERYEFPGGYGDPATRDHAALARDLAEGYVSPFPAATTRP